MFKNIQKYLLINQPLLWNLKIVPVAFYMAIFHIIFFILGYINGAINFTESEDHYDYNQNQGIIIFFSVLVSILTLVLWLVFYFKNNSLKSFYPKTKFSLFKEWGLIFVICLLLTSFTISFYYGKDVRVRNYFTEAEAKRRCEILSEGSMFVDGSFSEHSYDSDIAVPIAPDAVATSVDTVTEKKYILYRGKKYSTFSLLNKNINSYSFFDYYKDSSRKTKLKDWMVNNQKDSIRALFKKYLTITKEHNLRASIDENKWLDLIYDYPTFEKYKVIGGEEKSIFYDINNKNVVQNIDTSSQFIQEIKGENFLVNKFYVPEKSLTYSYDKVADSWNNPSVDFESFLIVLYLSLGLSLVIFSFKVTSGKNWLIALISLGVVNIVTGIISAITSCEYVYFTMIALLFISILIYFLLILSNKRGKGISGITTNVLLWLLPTFVPVVYFLCLEIAKKISGYNDVEYQFRKRMFPKIEYLNEIIPELMYLNFALVVLVMIFLTIKIQKWRGVAES